VGTGRKAEGMGGQEEGKDRKEEGRDDRRKLGREDGKWEGFVPNKFLKVGMKTVRTCL